MAFTIHLVVLCSAYLVASIAMRLLVLRSGLYLASAAVPFSMGAYVLAILSQPDPGLGLVGVALGIGVAAIAALLLGRLAGRVSIESLFATSLLLQGLFYLAIYNLGSPGYAVGSIRNLTNGPGGLPVLDIGISGPGVALGTLGASLLAYLWMRALERSTAGTALEAVRSEPEMARTLGAEPERMRSDVVLTSHLMLAASGALVAHQLGYVDPTLASIQAGLVLLALGLLSGVGGAMGPVVAVLLLIALPESLRLVRVSDTLAGYARLAAAAVAVLGILLLQRVKTDRQRRLTSEKR